jgi:homoserine acetyltransferase
MPGSTPTIYLDMYGSEFRRGYDAACVLSAMRQLDKSINEDGNLDAIFVRVHKESLIIIEGLIAENLFSYELRTPPGIKLKQQDVDIWLRIKTANGRQ